MPRELTAYGFRGMNNLPQAPGDWLDQERRVTPEYVVNAYLTDGNVVLGRQGYQKTVNLTKPHSLWSGSVALCVADGVQYPVSLWRITEQDALELCAVDGPRARLSYEEVNNRIYLSNPYWSGVYDLLAGQVRSWGVPLPPLPSVSLVDGDIPPGVYLLFYTQTVNGERSGNGPGVELRIEGATRGIQLNNLPTGGTAWITHPDGGRLFQAEVEAGNITRQVPLVQPLDTLGVQPPPKFTHFCYAFGRIWGAHGRYLYYSDPQQPSWFRPGKRLGFPEEVVMVAPVPDGLFVNSRTSTWFVAGHDPGKMVRTHIGDGAIPGTLTRDLVEGGGYEISRKLSQLPSPVWMDQHGFVVGSQNGHLVHLTKARMKIVPRSHGAALALTVNGVPQVLTSLFGPITGPDDDTLRFIFANNRLYVPEPVRVTGSGGLIISGGA